MFWCFGALPVYCAPSSVASAAEFSWELSGFRSENEDRTVDTTDVTGSALEATYHFQPVDDTRAPYALAAFVARSSRVLMAVRKDTQRVLSAPPSKGGSFLPKEESTEYSVAGRYVREQSGWYVGGALARSKTDRPPTFTTRSVSDRDAYGLVGGKYLAASTSLDLAVYKSRSTVRQFLVDCTVSCASAGADRDRDEVRLSAVHIGNLGQLPYALRGRVSTIEADLSASPGFVGMVWYSEPPLFAEQVLASAGTSGSPDSFALLDYSHYAVAVELFPTARLGARIGYSRWNPDENGLADGDAYELTGTWFATRNVAAEFAFFAGTAIRHSDFNEVESIALRLIGRF